MAGHRLYGKTDNMIDNRHTTSQSGQILTRQHFLLLVYMQNFYFGKIQYGGCLKFRSLKDISRIVT